jgi:hypothetical protein
MNKILLMLASILALSAQASLSERITLPQRGLTISQKKLGALGDFAKIQISNQQMSREVGRPELPIKSWLVQGMPDQIEVHVNVLSRKTLANLRVAPVEPQDCRCDTPQKRVLTSLENYSEPQAPVKKEYIGSFRGQPLTRVDILLANYEASQSKLEIFTDAQVGINADVFTLPKGDYKDYLIVTPANLEVGTRDFVQYKKNQGYNVIVESLSAPQVTLASIQQIISQHYQSNGIDFVMMIGDETALPMHQLPTSGSSATPSDLPYMTLEGTTDKVPDVFASRIATKSVEGVRKQLQKAMDFEQKNYVSAVGLKKVIGIASNEGANPSDKEYIESIGKEFSSVLNADATLLYQDDVKNSNPKVLNSKLDIGSLWITYIGHGSGTSWPSMAASYATTNIKQLKNKPVVKPILIDVACQNGRLLKGQLGTSFMEVGAASDFGAAAYYGGTVDISWHPPAVMAQGIAKLHMAQNYKHLGEALLAGQLHLASQWANAEETIDNLEWYHLQGDPGMNIQF